MREQTENLTDVQPSADETVGNRAVFVTSILSNLVAALFLALWGWSIAQDAAAMGAIPDEVYRAESQLEHMLFEIDHAGIGLVQDGVSGIREGMCHVPPEMSSVDELDPEMVDGGFLPQAPPGLSCADAEEAGSAADHS
jgi:hypothetical protein